MNSVFGKQKWTWLLPTTPRLQINTLELLYYETEVCDGKIKGNSEVKSLT